MARACVLTLEPGPGGVPALARVTYDLLSRAAHTPELVYRASDEVPSGSRLSMLRFFLTTPPVRRLVKQGMRSVAVADYPVPPRYQYHLLRAAGPALDAPIAAVVSGSSHVGLPLALSGRPYVLWVATLYDEELRARALAGDRWAAGFLQHPDWPILERQEQQVYEQAGLILGLSPNTSRQIARRWPGLAPRIRTALYPVDTGRVRPGDGPADPPYLFLSARIRDPRKNVDLLVRAFALIRREFPRLRLVIAGDEPSPATRALARALALSESITFAGHVSEAELLRLYQQAALFAFPSLQEGLGISVLEAMACGLPVVTTRCGGPEGIVEEGVTGRLTPTGDVSAFAETVCGLLRQPGQMRAMGAAGRARAIEQFDRTAVEGQLLEAFKTVFVDQFQT